MRKSCSVLVIRPALDAVVAYVSASHAVYTKGDKTGVLAELYRWRMPQL